MDAARTFAVPQIEIVRPRLVIALGLECFNGLRRALHLVRAPNMDAAAKSPIRLSTTSRIWCQAHTSALGQNSRNRGGVDRVTSDWQEMVRWYNNVTES